MIPGRVYWVDSSQYIIMKRAIERAQYEPPMQTLWAAFVEWWRS